MSCKSCLHSWVVPNPANYHARPGEPENMVCRRYPPVLQTLTRTHPISKQQEMTHASAFPPVNEAIVCGEYKTKLRTT
jgi:hypothetical protein